MGDGARLGARVLRTNVEGGGARGAVDEASLRFALRPRAAWRIEGATGVARFGLRAVAPVANRWCGELRARWRDAGGSPRFEARVERVTLASNPQLLSGLALRNEGRLALELPVRAFRLRGGLRGAMIEAGDRRNWRGTADGAVALALSPNVAPWIRYHHSGYRDPTDAGYFAPRRAQSVEVGSSFELGEGSPWSLSLDAGGGLQRIATHDGVAGSWKPALEFYGYLGRALGPGRELRLEAEAENSIAVTTSATTSGSWSYGSLSLALRWALR